MKIIIVAISIIIFVSCKAQIYNSKVRNRIVERELSK